MDKSKLSTEWRDLLPEEQQLFVKYVSDDGLYSDQAELAILSIAFSSVGENTILSIPELRPEHFYHAAYQAIYHEILQCLARGQKPDIIVMKNILSSHPEVVAAAQSHGKDVPSFLVSIYSASGYSLLGAKQYAQLIIELYERRELIGILRSGFAKLRNVESSPNTKPIVDEIMSSVSQLSATSSAKHITFGQVTSDIVQSFNKPRIATPTGIPKLDEALQGGFYPGKNYCFIAEPKAGKSMLMGSILYNMAMSKHRARYYACEMGSQELHYRFLARFMGTNASEFYRKFEDPVFQARVKQAEATLHENDIRGGYVDCPGIKFEELKRDLIATSRRGRVEGVFLDYMGKIKGQAKGQGRSDFEEEVADWLHCFAKQEGIWVCYACQLNREGKIRGSDGALMGADVIYQIERHEETPTAHLKCEASRYTARIDVGKSASNPGLRIGTAPYYRCASTPVEDDLSDMEKMMGVTSPAAYYDSLMNN